jgi:hypothetical protein
MCYVLQVKEKKCGCSIPPIFEKNKQVHQVCFLLFMEDYLLLVPIGWLNCKKMWSFCYLKEVDLTKKAELKIEEDEKEA